MLIRSYPYIPIRSDFRSPEPQPEQCLQGHLHTDTFVITAERQRQELQSEIDKAQTEIEKMRQERETTEQEHKDEIYRLKMEVQSGKLANILFL